MRTTAAIAEITAVDYHADRLADTPSLSASLCKVLVNQSPAHAFTQHPRLNPDFVREDDDRFNIGNAVHSLFLEGVNSVAICPFKDWKTQAAKDAKADALGAGKIPMLPTQFDECERIVEALRAQTAEHAEGPFFTDGKPEQTLVWEDDYGVVCRARLDWLLDDYSAIHDLKTTKVPGGASQDAWSRTLFGISAHLQYVFYLRGAKKCLGVEPDFRFYVVETAPPFASSVHALAPDAIELANKQIDYALKTWAKCLRNDHWPAYEQQVAYATTPAWMESQWLERELREVA